MSQLKDRQRKQVLSSQSSVLFRSPKNWMKPSHTPEDNLLSSAYEFKC